MGRVIVAFGVFGCALTGCGGSESSRFDWLPEASRREAEAAVGFEHEALADGRASRDEVLEGFGRHAACLRELGYTAWVDELGQINYLGTAMSDAEYDGCAVGNSEVLYSLYQVSIDGPPEEQRQRQIDCLIEIGELREGATPKDFELLLKDKKRRNVDLTVAEANCMDQAIRGRVGI